MISIYGIESFINEAITIPWRSGTVPIRFVKFSLKGDIYYGLMVNELKQFLSLIPSFVVATANQDIFINSSTGDSDNAFIIPAIVATTVGFSFTNVSKQIGECDLLFQLFSSDKQDWRQLDLWYRLFEREMILKDIREIDELEGKSFSVVIKKEYYNVQTAITGDVKAGVAPFRRRRTVDDIVPLLKKDPTKALELFPARITVIN